jgi:hypothetical protein
MIKESQSNIQVTEYKNMVFFIDFATKLLHIHQFWMDSSFLYWAWDSLDKIQA